jgi:NAD-dependent SIR2 family protein deacetylase
MVDGNLPLVREWSDCIHDVIAERKPNVAHIALAEPQLGGAFQEFPLVTQNIIELHTDAGLKGLIELKGIQEVLHCLSGE